MNKYKIEEILSNIQFQVYSDMNFIEPLGLDKETWKELLDYITNLQEENEYFNHCDEEKEKQKKFLKKIDKELTITEYDEIKYWLANVEILDNTDYILNNRKAKILIRYLKEKDKEIERLNNIIYELEKFLDGKYNEWKDSENENIRESAYEDLRILEYLKELKGEKIKE